jgi:2-(1,2-epoxy-1,2-dihydrophenyl)acetyl-CoA isomerase
VLLTIEMADPEVRGLRRELAGGVLTITLDRPDRLNALRWEMVHGLTDWVSAAGSDPDVRAVVVTGAGRAFCSGDDIVGGMGDGGTDMKVMRRRILDATTRGPHHLLVKTFLSTPKPIVAALNGRCHGAGFVIASACDFRVARDDVLLGDIRSGKAIFANQGVGLLLPRLIGQARAMDLLMTGRVIDAAEAERIGYVARVWPADSFAAELGAFVGELATGPTRTYAAWKLSVNRAVLLDLDAYTDHERWLDVGVFHSDDIVEGVRAFAEKRPPRFTGR